MRIRATYNETTPESASDGDYSDRGWLDEDGHVCDDINDAVNYLKRAGICYSSSTAFHPGIWYSTQSFVTSYQTGTEREESYHLDEFTPEQEREVWDRLKADRVLI